MASSDFSPDLISQTVKLIAEQNAQIPELQFVNSGTIEVTSLLVMCNTVFRLFSPEAKQGVLVQTNVLPKEDKVLRKIMSPFLPNIYCYDASREVLLLEDLPDYKDLYLEMIRGNAYKVAVRKIAECIAEVHKDTHVSHLSETDFTQLQQSFQSSDLNAEKQRIFPDIDSIRRETDTDYLKRVLGRIEGSQSLSTAISQLADIFTNKKECLIHGNLHIHNVLVKDVTPKIFGWNHSFIGPASFDFASLLSDLIWMHQAHMLTPQNNDDHRRVAYKILEICSNAEETYWDHMTTHSGDRQEYIEQFISETAGFTGVLLLQRSLTSLRSEDHRLGEIADDITVATETLECGTRLLERYQRIKSVGQLLNIALMLTF